MSSTSRPISLLLPCLCLVLIACSPSGDDSNPASADEAAEAPVGLSDPQRDSNYPEVGSTVVDALSYDLVVAWDQDTRILTGEQELEFRATEDADEFTLDFSDALELETGSLDGGDFAFTGSTDKLTIKQPVEADETYTLSLTYSGTPEPAEAPTTRPDFKTTGFTIDPDGSAWTMQEPFGAFTWYAVNDHPSDKALYTITTRAKAPFLGVANGRATEETTKAGLTQTTWTMTEPAASYLVTVAFDEYERTEFESGSGVPISVFTPAGNAAVADDLSVVTEAMDWLEERLGPYPFESYGMVVVESPSAMETQTMATMGNTTYATSPEVVVHELAHHWYGNTVGPNDWQDMWLNEGMTMYLQGMWEAEAADISIQEQMDEWAGFEGYEREYAGPPGDYDADKFASGNVYFSPALMFHELRFLIGDEAFSDLMRAWPAERRNVATDREDYVSFAEEQTGEDLQGFFGAWLLGEETPERPSAAS